jgi:hypothetical protein
MLAFAHRVGLTVSANTLPTSLLMHACNILQFGYLDTGRILRRVLSRSPSVAGIVSSTDGLEAFIAIQGPFVGTPLYTLRLLTNDAATHPLYF